MDFVFAQAWPPVLHTFTAQDLDMVAVFGAYWSNFVESGDPNKGAAPAPLAWPAFVPGGNEYSMQLALPLSVTARLDGEVCDEAWDPFYAGLRASGARAAAGERFPVLAARVRARGGA